MNLGCFVTFFICLCILVNLLFFFKFCFDLLFSNIIYIEACSWCLLFSLVHSVVYSYVYLLRSVLNKDKLFGKMHEWHLLAHTVVTVTPLSLKPPV